MSAETVNVQLSAAGIKFAAGKPLSIHAGAFSGAFSAGTQYPVTPDEWVRVLQPTNVGGKDLFEIVPAPAATETPAPAPAKASTPKATPAPPPAATSSVAVPEHD